MSTDPFSRPPFPRSDKLPPALEGVLPAGSNMAALVPLASLQLAEMLYDRIQSQINQLQNQLAKAQHVEVWYQRAGLEHKVLSLGYDNPNLIILYAVDAAKRPLRILVHANAVELALKIGNVPGNEGPRREGFNGQILETTPETASGEDTARAETCQPVAPQTNAC